MGQTAAKLSILVATQPVATATLAVISDVTLAVIRSCPAAILAVDVE